MKPTIESPENIEYKKDQAIIEGILKKVPEEYLVGLKKVVLHKSMEGEKRVCYKGGEDGEVHLDMSFYEQNIRFYSVFALNLDILLSISDHIISKKNVTENQIKNFKNRINRSWMYFGKWTIPAYFIYVILYPLDKANRLKAKIFDKIIKNIEKNNFD